jgi:hypothetical protein
MFLVLDIGGRSDACDDKMEDYCDCSLAFNQCKICYRGFVLVWYSFVGMLSSVIYLLMRLSFLVNCLLAAGGTAFNGVVVELTKFDNTYSTCSSCVWWWWKHCWNCPRSGFAHYTCFLQVMLNMCNSIAVGCIVPLSLVKTFHHS